MMDIRRLIPILIALIIGGILSPIAASPMQIDRIEIIGDLPVTQIFRVDQYPDSVNFNLVESRNSIVDVATYTLISNNGSSKFNLVIRPGEFGESDEFTFVLDEDEMPRITGKQTILPFAVRVSSNTDETISVAGSRAMEKQLGVRGGLKTNADVVYEDGVILAEIPDFDPDQYAAGHYSAVMQLSVEAL